MWQALHSELAADGFTVITVAQDRGADDAREWIEAARPTHPALVDANWLLADLYNIEQVPTMLWIDEEGRIVRPHDTTFGDNTFQSFTGIDSAVHRRLLYGWVREGVHLGADRVQANLPLPTDDDQLARAEFGLARHLWSVGQRDRAEQHFIRADELAPAQFTIRRGSMPMRGKDPMGPEFMAMMAEWVGSGRPLNRVVPE